jgi:hypothetical protein
LFLKFFSKLSIHFEHRNIYKNILPHDYNNIQYSIFEFKKFYKIHHISHHIAKFKNSKNKLFYIIDTNNFSQQKLFHTLLHLKVTRWDSRFHAYFAFSWKFYKKNYLPFNNAIIIFQSTAPFKRFFWGLNNFSRFCFRICKLVK